MLTWTSSCNFTLNTCFMLWGLKDTGSLWGRNERLRPRGDITLIYLPPKLGQPPTHHYVCYFHCARPKGGEKKKERKRVWFEMQWDPECSPSVVYFHRNIPGVDSYSLVWKAESQRNFSRLRPGRGTPTITLIDRTTLSFCTSTLERQRRRRKGSHGVFIFNVKKKCTLTFHCPLQHVAPPEMSR